MGDHRWKKGLQQVYQPPAPQMKEKFVEQFQEPELSSTRFLLTQVAYLRPWNWIISVAIFALALFLTESQQLRSIWLVSALLPFAALSTVTELTRSARYHMEELEMSARFSLKTLLMARLALLGLGNLLLLVVLLSLVAGWSELSWAVTGCFLLCPYCLTSLVCLTISRRFRGREMAFPCAVAAAAVSGLCLWCQDMPWIMWRGNDIAVWAGITLVLLALMLWEYRCYLLRGEEWTWN